MGSDQVRDRHKRQNRERSHNREPSRKVRAGVRRQSPKHTNHHEVDRKQQSHTPECRCGLKRMTDSVGSLKQFCDATVIRIEHRRGAERSSRHPDGNSCIECRRQDRNQCRSRFNRTLEHVTSQQQDVHHGRNRQRACQLQSREHGHQTRAQ